MKLDEMLGEKRRIGGRHFLELTSAAGGTVLRNHQSSPETGLPEEGQTAREKPAGGQEGLPRKTTGFLHKKGFRRAAAFGVAGSVLVGLLVVSMFTDFHCIIVRAGENSIVYIASVNDGDSVIISHTNSIYDAPVHEQLEVQGAFLVMRNVDTDSEGIREYYGIADSKPRGKWSTIRVFSTRGRKFSLAVGGNHVNAFREKADTHFIIELKNVPGYRYAFWKLYLFI